MLHAENSLFVLCIDNPSECHQSLISELEKLNYRVSFQLVNSKDDLLFHLKRRSWNLVIGNYNFENISALDSVKIVRSVCSDLPFILLADKIGEESVADMMNAGVEDIVMKSRLERVLPAVKRILRAHDIKAKEIRAQKLANEAFAAKEQMLAIVSHDIKNPLSAINLDAQMLLRATSRAGKSLLAEEVKIQANRILKTTDRLKLLISDLLDNNKTENGFAKITKSRVDVVRLVQDVFDSLRPLVQEKEIILKTLLPAEITISADRNKVFQVFSNLLNNAIKFTPQGGIIEVSVEENEHEYIFSVDDSGQGLQEKELNKVFQKYWTGNAPDGTGLGLFICKSIVEAHEGHIFVENIPGKGARFRFSIPRSSKSLKDASFSSFENRNDLRKKIYIVDDDEDLREVISWALNKEGYSIHSFHSPNEALDCLMLGRNLPHLIVVDFHMDEMNGSEFLIRKNEIQSAKECPVLMISASPQEVESQIPAHHYNEVLTKPIDLEGLVDNVRKSLIN